MDYTTTVPDEERLALSDTHFAVRVLRCLWPQGWSDPVPSLAQLDGRDERGRAVPRALVTSRQGRCLGVRATESSNLVRMP